MESARFEPNRPHMVERIMERYGKIVASSGDAENLIDRIIDVLERNTPVDWRFTESPSSRFFIVDQVTGARFMGFSFRESREPPRLGREIVKAVRDGLGNPSVIMDRLGSFVAMYVEDVLNPELTIVHNIRTVYGSSERANIREEKHLFEQARSSVSHVIPLMSRKIASRPNAIVTEGGSLWVRQHLNWMGMEPNGREYYLFQPLTREGVEKGRFAIFSYFNEGRLERVGEERAFHCGEFQRAMDEEKGKIPGKERIRSESYWKVPTYLDCRLIDLDFKERTTKGETKDALDPKNVISAPESLELLFLRRIVAEARNRLHR